MNNDRSRYSKSLEQHRLCWIPRDFNLFKYDPTFMDLPEEIEIEISRKAVARFAELWTLSVLQFPDLHLYPFWELDRRKKYYLQVHVCLGYGTQCSGKLTFGVSGLKATKHIEPLGDYDPYYGDEIISYEVERNGEEELSVYQD